jgi:hypothetical protein
VNGPNKLVISIYVPPLAPRRLRLVIFANHPVCPFFSASRPRPTRGECRDNNPVSRRELRDGLHGKSRPGVSHPTAAS